MNDLTSQETKPTEQSNDQQVLNLLDQNKIISDLNKRTEDLASNTSAKIKQDLIDSLGGNKDQKPWEKEGSKNPRSWDELMETTEKNAIEKAEARIMKKLDAKEKAREEASKKLQQDQKIRTQEQLSQYSNDFRDLINEGKIEIEPEIKEKLFKGETLTSAEKASSKGIKAWVKLRDLAFKNQMSVYKAFHKHYNKQSAGANAPVFGLDGQVASEQAEEEYSYEDVVEARMKMNR